MFLLVLVLLWLASRYVALSLPPPLLIPVLWVSRWTLLDCDLEHLRITRKFLVWSYCWLVWNVLDSVWSHITCMLLCLHFLFSHFCRLSACTILKVLSPCVLPTSVRCVSLRIQAQSHFFMYCSLSVFVQYASYCLWSVILKTPITVLAWSNVLVSR